MCASVWLFFRKTRNVLLYLSPAIILCILWFKNFLPLWNFFMFNFLFLFCFVSLHSKPHVPWLRCVLQPQVGKTCRAHSEKYILSFRLTLTKTVLSQTHSDSHSKKFSLLGHSLTKALFTETHSDPDFSLDPSPSESTHESVSLALASSTVVSTLFNTNIPQCSSWCRLTQYL